jgi:hypothetical protein
MPEDGECADEEREEGDEVFGCEIGNAELGHPPGMKFDLFLFSFTLLNT